MFPSDLFTAHEPERVVMPEAEWKFLFPPPNPVHPVNPVKIQPGLFCGPLDFRCLPHKYFRRRPTPRLVDY